MYFINFHGKEFKAQKMCHDWSGVTLLIIDKKSALYQGTRICLLKLCGF